MMAAFPLRDSSTERHGLDPHVATGFRAALDAALVHLGATAPNPPVGCAVLDQAGRVLVAAGHPRAGQPHAEALALRRLAETGRLADARTLVVTLEPCNHQGRTGPCTEAILSSPVREVWVGCPDPNPHVAGHGIERLRAAGIGVRQLDQDDPAHRALFDECQALIAPFRGWARDGRPWITVKQAVDRNGGMIPPAGATTFTGSASLLLAHRLRRATDAVVTGAGTVRADRPRLSVRLLPDHRDRAPRLLAVVGRADALPDGYVADRERDGFRVHVVPDPALLPALLAEHGVLWAMVEAGPRLLRSLDALDLPDDRLRIDHPGDAPDRLSVFVAPGRGVSPLSLLPELRGLAPEKEAACFPAS